MKKSSIQLIYYSHVPALGAIIGLICFPIISNAATIVDLGALGGEDSSQGYGIADTARAIAISFNSSSPTITKAVYTEPGQAIIDNTPPNVHYSLNTNSLVTWNSTITWSKGFDIFQSSSSADIFVVGEMKVTSANYVRPFWYKNSGGNVYIREPVLPAGAVEGSVQAVVDAYSVLVGYAKIGSRVNACYWNVNPDLNVVYNYGNWYYPEYDSYAFDSTADRTVGYYVTDVPIPFIIDTRAGGGAFDLPAPSAGGVALAINSSGKVVGYDANAGYTEYTKPIYWNYTTNGQATYTLLPLPPGKANGAARGINNAGAIVGSAWNNASDEVAVYWPTLTSVTDLNTLVSGWTLQRAYKINDSANIHIVGYGIKGGATRGFVLTAAGT